MAVYYVYSGAGGSNNGSSWANAFTTLTTAFATEAAGDTLYVAHDHAETTAADVTLTSSGTLSNPTKVVCVSRSGSVPPVSADRLATAAVTVSGGNNLNITGTTHYDGLIFIAGTGASSSSFLTLQTANNVSLRFDNCSLRLGISTGGSRMSLCGSSNNLGGGYFELNNTTLSFGHTDNLVNLSGILRWRNTASALIGAAVPTSIFFATAARGGSFECSGVDLSAAGSGKTLVDGSNAQGFSFRFVDCKLNASVTKETGAVTAHGSYTVDFIRSGSSGVNYTVHSARYTGTLDQETTIVRSGGASDGTTTIAWKIITTSTANYSMPFECPVIAIWNDVSGSSVTATVEGIWGGGAVPLDDEIWLDVEYLSDASSPKASFVNDGKADLLATAANQTSSSETWGGSTTKFKLAVSFTAQQKGWIYARVKCAKASSTFYIDPLVTLT